MSGKFDLLKAAKAVREQDKQEKESQKRERMLDSEIAAAWDILCPDGKSVVTKSQLYENMKLVFPHTSARDIKELVGPGNMSLEKLQMLLGDAPIAEENIEADAYHFLDPQGTGAVDIKEIHKILAHLPGIGSLDEDDKLLIQNLCDADKDGKVSFEDFKQIGSWGTPKEEISEHLQTLLKQREAKEKREKILEEERRREKERLAKEKE